MHTLSAESTEYVRVAVGSTVNGSEINPTTDNVQMQFVPAGGEVDDLGWLAATWETDSSVTPNIYYARVLVGPTGGTVLLTRGLIYDTYVKVADNPETVVRNTGAVGIL